MKHKKHVEIHEKARVPVLRRVLGNLLPARQVHIEEDMDESDDDDADNDGGVGWRGVMGLAGMVGLVGLFAWRSRGGQSEESRQPDADVDAALLPVAVNDATAVAAAAAAAAADAAAAAATAADAAAAAAAATTAATAADAAAAAAAATTAAAAAVTAAAAGAAPVDIVVDTTAGPDTVVVGAGAANPPNPFFVDMYLGQLSKQYPNTQINVDSLNTAKISITSGLIDDMVKQVCAGYYSYSKKDTGMSQRMAAINIMLTKAKSISEMCKNENPTIGVIVENVSELDIPEVKIQKANKVQKPNTQAIEKDYIFVAALVFYIDVLITSLTGRTNNKRSYFNGIYDQASL
jgi:hypothetical protein